MSPAPPSVCLLRLRLLLNIISQILVRRSALTACAAVASAAGPLPYVTRKMCVSTTPSATKILLASCLPAHLGLASAVGIPASIDTAAHPNFNCDARSNADAIATVMSVAPGVLAIFDLFGRRRWCGWGVLERLGLDAWWGRRRWWWRGWKGHGGGRGLRRPK